MELNGWSVVYKKAIADDGTLLFPERLNREFLDNARRVMGSYYFANQYQNEVIPDDAKVFKPNWLRYYSQLPEGGYRFAFIDPAIGQKDHHDYTGIAVVEVDTNRDWYLIYAGRYRLNPTGIVQKIEEIQNQFKCQAIGVEIVAYQEALLYILDEYMREKNIILPVKGIKRNRTSKQSRILGLVPRFEFGRLFIAQGLTEFEDEYASFPRGKFDDILDSLASLEELVYYPEKVVQKLERDPFPTDPNYESWYLKNKAERGNNESNDYNSNYE